MTFQTHHGPRVARKSTPYADLWLLADIDGEGFMPGLSGNRTKLPYDGRPSYPRALSNQGLTKYPFNVVPSLPL